MDEMDCVWFMFFVKLSYKIMLYRNGIRKAEHKNENKKIYCKIT